MNKIERFRFALIGEDLEQALIRFRNGENIDNIQLSQAENAPEPQVQELTEHDEWVAKRDAYLEAFGLSLDTMTDDQRAVIRAVMDATLGAEPEVTA